jgi:hypothetical protein
MDGAGLTGPVRSGAETVHMVAYQTSGASRSSRYRSKARKCELYDLEKLQNENTVMRLTAKLMAKVGRSSFPFLFSSEGSEALAPRG